MQVIVTPKAQKQYEHLPRADQLKIKKKLHALKDNPLAGKKLSGSLSGLYSIKAWPYRIIYYLTSSDQKLFVVTIAHRQGVYN